MTMVLVDAANVVGSRPDGWWRDRAGATARLLARLASLPGRTVARPGRWAGGLHRGRGGRRGPGARRAGTGRRAVVRAPGSGDDALAAGAERLGRPRGRLAV